MPIDQNMSPCPDAPSRADPTNFDDRADELMNWLEGLPPELNQFALELNNTQQAINQSESTASNAASSANTSAQTAANWAAQMDVKVGGSDYSAKEWAIGTTVPEGSAKTHAQAAEANRITSEAVAAAIQSAAGFPSLAGNDGKALMVSPGGGGVFWGVPNKAKFTEILSSGQFTPDPASKTLFVEVVNGGCSGGCYITVNTGTTSSNTPFGGGGGAAAQFILEAEGLPSTIPVIVGSGASPSSLSGFR